MIGKVILIVAGGAALGLAIAAFMPHGDFPAETPASSNSAAAGDYAEDADQPPVASYAAPPSRWNEDGGSSADGYGYGRRATPDDGTEAWRDDDRPDDGSTDDDYADAGPDGGAVADAPGGPDSAETQKADQAADEAARDVEAAEGSSPVPAPVPGPGPKR